MVCRLSLSYGEDIHLRATRLFFLFFSFTCFMCKNHFKVITVMCKIRKIHMAGRPCMSAHKAQGNDENKCPSRLSFIRNTLGMFCLKIVVNKGHIICDITYFSSNCRYRRYQQIKHVNNKSVYHIEFGFASDNRCDASSKRSHIM